jgi:hypothetical protein
MNPAVEILELRLSDADIAALRLRHQRRGKQNLGGCGFVDLEGISSAIRGTGICGRRKFMSVEKPCGSVEQLAEMVITAINKLSPNEKAKLRKDLVNAARGGKA